MTPPSINGSTTSGQSSASYVSSLRQRSPSAEFENPLYFSDMSWYSSASEFSHSQIFSRRHPEPETISPASDASNGLIFSHHALSPEQNGSRKTDIRNRVNHFTNLSPCSNPPLVTDSKISFTAHSPPLSPAISNTQATLDNSSDSVHSSSSSEFPVATQMSDDTVSACTSALSPQSVCSSTSPLNPRNLKMEPNAPNVFASPQSPKNTSSQSPSKVHSPMSLLFHQSASPPMKVKNQPLTQATTSSPQSQASGPHKTTRIFNPFLSPPFPQRSPRNPSPRASASTTVSTLPPTSDSSASSTTSVVSASIFGEAPPSSASRSYPLGKESSTRLPDGWMQSPWAQNFVLKILQRRKSQGYDDSNPRDGPPSTAPPTDTLNVSGLFSDTGEIDFSFFDQPDLLPTNNYDAGPSMHRKCFDNKHSPLPGNMTVNSNTISDFRALLERIPGVAIIPYETKDNGESYGPKISHPAEQLFFSQEDESIAATTNTVVHNAIAIHSVAKHCEDSKRHDIGTSNEKDNQENMLAGIIEDQQSEKPVSAFSRLDVAFQRLFGAMWESFEFTSQGVVEKECPNTANERDAALDCSHSSRLSSEVHTADAPVAQQQDIVSTQETILSNSSDWSDTSLPNNLQHLLSPSSECTSEGSFSSIPGWGGFDTSTCSSTSLSSVSSSSSYESLLKSHNPSVYRRDSDSDRGSSPQANGFSNDYYGDAMKSEPLHLTESEDQDQSILKALMTEMVVNDLEIQEKVQGNSVKDETDTLEFDHVHMDDHVPKVVHLPLSTPFGIRREPEKEIYPPSQSLLSPPLKNNAAPDSARTAQSPPETPILPDSYAITGVPCLSDSTVAKDRKRLREGTSNDGGAVMCSLGNNTRQQHARPFFSPDAQAPRSKRLSTHELRPADEPLPPLVKSKSTINFRSKDRIFMEGYNAQCTQSHVPSQTNVVPSMGRTQLSPFLTKKDKTQLQLHFPKSPIFPPPSTATKKYQSDPDKQHDHVYSPNADNSDVWIDSRQIASYHQAVFSRKR